jgi:hypothetical protein
MLGEELYHEYRANLQALGKSSKEWNKLSNIKKLAWNKTANDITAGHQFVLSALNK